MFFMITPTDPIMGYSTELHYTVSSTVTLSLKANVTF